MEVLTKVPHQEVLQAPTEELQELSLEELCEVFGGGVFGDSAAR